MPEHVPGLLHGGPYDGKRITVDPGHDRIQMVMPPKLPVVLEVPSRPPWWRPLARRRWRPPIPPEPEPFRQLLYRYLATSDDGKRIYDFDPWNTAPPVEPLGDDLRKYLIEHLYSVHPRERQHMHWVMNPEWMDECRKLADGPVVGTGLFLLGMPVTVNADGGIPHLMR